MSGENGTMGPTMRAMRVHSRAGPTALVIDTLPIPCPGPGEVLVRVRAAGITPTEFTWNSTFTSKDGRERLPAIPGFEFSGTVAALPPSVSDFVTGDEVYGLLDFWRDGAAAEYVVAKAADLALKPRSADHIRAAAIPLSGLTAWQALFDGAHLEPGERVLIHGASGGVGSYAVQLARYCGAFVIASASLGRGSFLRDLGANEVIDYTHERFEDRAGEVDAVLDTVGGDTLERSWSTLRRGGTLVSIVGDVDVERAKALGVRAVSLLVRPDRAELIELARLVDSGTVRPVVDAVFPLASAREAYERGANGHNRGKTVLRIDAPVPHRAGGTPTPQRARDGSGVEPGTARVSAESAPEVR